MSDKKNGIGLGIKVILALIAISTFIGGLLWNYFATSTGVETNKETIQRVEKKVEIVDVKAEVNEDKLIRFEGKIDTMIYAQKTMSKDIDKILNKLP